MTLQLLCDRKACVFILSLLQAIKPVINFRVRLEYVQCESNEAILSQIWQFDNKCVPKEKCQRKTESFIL